MVRVKVCGLTSVSDAQLIAELGFHLMGFIFADSPRQVKASEVKEIIKRVPSRVQKVGVFVNEKPDKVLSIASYCGLDLVQLHGDETPAYCNRLQREGLRIIKAFRVKDQTSLKGLSEFRQEGVDFFLLDSHHPHRRGGTGSTFDWRMIMGLEDRIFLAGGLRPDNLFKAVKKVNPYALDLNSGVEIKPGKKDPVLLRRVAEILFDS